jgi:hypothetical protein
VSAPARLLCTARGLRPAAPRCSPVTSKREPASWLPPALLLPLLLPLLPVPELLVAPLALLVLLLLLLLLLVVSALAPLAW